ncbi:MAG: alpha/beta fold hydrolase [Acidobacteria bacterium]|nr:alpha/beta fold hydrolase [Acidobacteriota bacterium]
MQYVYLHGFASSPASSKAVYLAERLAGTGSVLHLPDLNEPDFSTLTVSRVIAQVSALVAELPPDPVTLFGSSLGAFAALHAAERQCGGDSRPISRLVLLAPAFDFGRAAIGELGAEGMARWRETGWWELTHYASGATTRVHYELYADAARYNSFAARRRISTLVLQGDRDEIVDAAMVARWAERRPHVRLVRLDDDHQLAASHERIWWETARFLDLPA